ncbi:MAG: serine/threonine-protein kinase [Myxococcales bacterium]|nr:serine/threonine-protein kinase [Myxococcales bacterium]
MSLETYGRYQLLKKLATGGMAQIYLARQLGVQGFEKLLVVKRILPHLAENEDFITMFLDEARIAARLNHPNVVQIFDLGQQDDTFYIAMEYIHGEDVRKVWKQAERQGTAIPIPLICRIIIESCSGLDYAHKKADPGGRPLNIVHRDISPQNILVSFEGGVKVVDFGIAKAADQATVTKSGVLKGKYSYMSPEQAQGKPVDARTDVFALGVVLYELLTGARLFKRANDIQTLNAVTECKIEPPSNVDARLPKDLDPIVMRALAKNREDRYPDAREMQQALEDWVLKNKLPSGSVHLAAFMQDIYAERLAREAEEGRLEFTESQADQSRSEQVDKATPNRPPKSLRTPTISKQGPSTKSGRKEATRAEAGRSGPISRANELPLGADVKPPPTENSLPTQQGAPSKGPLVALALVFVVALGLGGYVAFRPTRSHVVITSTPSGASVRVDGKAIDCRTPCTLPSLPSGDHAVELTKAGYTPGTTQISVPSSGEANFEVTLTKEATVQPAVIVEVALTITSEPPGAAVTIDGTKRGVTPLTLKVPPGASAAVTLELAGHQGVSERVEVPKDQAEFSKAFTLKAGEKKDPLVVTKKDPVKKDPLVVKKEPEVRPVGSGTVRFVVTPYANVECPPYKFGDTPFGDKQMAAGDYKCTFTNGELGKTLTRSVHIDPGEVQKVKVTFE